MYTFCVELWSVVDIALCRWGENVRRPLCVPFLFMFRKLSPVLSFQKFEPNLWGLRKGVASLVCVQLEMDGVKIVIVLTRGHTLMSVSHFKAFKSSVAVCLCGSCCTVILKANQLPIGSARLAGWASQ